MTGENACTHVHTHSSQRHTRLGGDKTERGTARPFCTEYKVILVREEPCAHVEGGGGCWSHGGWASQDKNGNKACGSREMGLKLPCPQGGRPAGGEGHTVSPGHEPRRPKSSAITTMQALPCSHACRRGGEGACVYKDTAVPSPSHPSPSTNRVQTSWLCPLPEAGSCQVSL